MSGRLASVLKSGKENLELLKQNLAIEPDLQNFIGFVLSSVKTLGGNTFAAALGAIDLFAALRAAGAGTGYPLPVALVLTGNILTVEWGDHHQLNFAILDASPAADKVETLRKHLQQSTEMQDPSVLLRRNAEMERFLNETRARAEKEMATLQASLEKRQEELAVTIHQAETDALTGLLNRRAFDAKLHEAFHRTVRQKTESLSLVLLDLDFFKQINDEFGHQFGDAYLNKMGHAMRSAIRDGVDMAFRFGGDEFAILMFCDETYACSRAMEVLGLMDNKVSIGVASIRPEDADHAVLEDFIRRADDALYEAKRSGRGRVVLANCRSPDGNGCVKFCPKHYLQQTLATHS